MSTFVAAAAAVAPAVAAVAAVVAVVAAVVAVMAAVAAAVVAAVAVAAMAVVAAAATSVGLEAGEVATQRSTCPLAKGWVRQQSVPALPELSSARPKEGATRLALLWAHLLVRRRPA